MLTFLVVLFFLNGEVRTSQLPSTSHEMCLVEINATTDAIETLGGVVFRIGCLTEKES
jgi:hypothetical protein